MKQEILDRINELIEEEKGTKVTIDDMFLDSKLDSLGVTLTLIALDADYGYLKDVPEGKEFDGVDELSVKDLVKKCVLASTSTSKAPN